MDVQLAGALQAAARSRIGVEVRHDNGQALRALALRTSPRRMPTGRAPSEAGE
jgi:hypothetical protein